MNIRRHKKIKKILDGKNLFRIFAVSTLIIKKNENYLMVLDRLFFFG